MILKNSRHEIVACERFQGKSLQEAMEKAGYSPKWARSTGSRLLSTNANVLARIQELQGAVASEAVMSVREIEERLSEIARGRLTDYTTCGPDRDLIDVGPESPNTAALQEVTSKTEYDKDGSGTAVITKIKLHNPMTAMDMLIKRFGAYPPAKIELETGIGEALAKLLSGLRGYKDD